MTQLQEILDKHDKNRALTDGVYNRKFTEQAILAWIDEVIGSDFEINPDILRERQRMYRLGANEVKKELRQKFNIKPKEGR